MGQRRTKREARTPIRFSAQQRPASRLRLMAGRDIIRRPGLLLGRYDAAQTTADNRKHWASADHLSADAAHQPEVRRVLRSRARYEFANNCYARGMALTLANDVIGTGPRLQITTGDPDLNATVESRYAAWARAVRMAEKLRTARLSRCVDGEAFVLQTTNPRLRTAVKLDLRLVETDQITDPTWSRSARRIDGVEFDDDGNVDAYLMLTEHPGDLSIRVLADFERVPATAMLHWFRTDRPGQHRGVSEMTPALGLYSQLRRYTQAVLDAAEAAADFALALKTDSPPDGEAEVGEAFDVLELERRLLTTLPMGWDITQIRPEQPSTVYDAFKAEIIKEIARCMCMPYNVAAGDSSQYNYASGRLDYQAYFKAIRADRHQIEIVVLDPAFDWWLAEALRIPGYLPAAARTQAEWPRQWFWPGWEHVDPSREANAQQTRLACGATSFPREFAREGLDWEAEMKAQAKALGISLQEYQALLRQKLFGAPARPKPGAKEDETDEKDDEGETREDAA